MERNLTRRSFVTASSAAALSAALVGSGCAMENSELSQTGEAPAANEDDVKVVRTTCSPNCQGSCGINAFVKDNTILKVEPAEFPDDPYLRRICPKGIAYAMQRVTHADRIKYPMRRVEGTERGAGEWERLSWDEAMDAIVAEFNKIKDAHGARAVATVFMTGNLTTIAMNTPARITNLWGATNINQGGLMGDGAMNIGFLPTLGVFDEGNSWTDTLEGAKLLITTASNFAETSINDMRYVLDGQERGMKYVSLDPRLSHSAAKADLWIPLRPGTDAAFFLGMTQHIIANGWHDKSYLHDHTNAPFLVHPDTGKLLRQEGIGGAESGYVAWSESAQAPADPSTCSDCALTGTYPMTIDGVQVNCPTAFQLLVDKVNEFYTPAQVAEICEIDEQIIKDLADEYANQGPSCIRMGQGAQRYWQGHLAVICPLVLGMVCGNIGKKNAGVNWSGGALLNFAVVGMSPDWLRPDPSVEIPAPISGSDMYDRLMSDEPYPIKALWCMQYGMGTQGPRLKHLIEDVFPTLDMIIVSDNILTPAAQHADIVLPITTFYEEEDGDITPGAMNKTLQMRHQAIEPLWEAKSDWQVGRLFAEKIGKLDLWDAHGQTVMENMKWAAQNSPNDEARGADYDRIKETGSGFMDAELPYVAFKDHIYPTPTGRAQLYFEDLVESGENIPCYKEPIESNRNPLAEKYPLTFMNCHGYFTAHSQHVNLPWIRELVPEPSLEMNSIDAVERGLKDGDKVRVFNDRGSFICRLSVLDGIRPGCINLPQGWWPSDFDEGHLGDLLHYEPNPAQNIIIETNYSPYDNLVEVELV